MGNQIPEKTLTKDIYGFLTLKKLKLLKKNDARPYTT